MVGWHHRLNGHEFEHTLGDNEGQGSLAQFMGSKSLKMVTSAMKLKDTCSLEEKLCPI